MRFQFSAGGIVYKHEGDPIRPVRQAQGKHTQGKQTLILVAKHSGHKGWVFPKGIIGDNVKGESKESTAVREVKEETGIKAEIEKELEPVSYWFKFEGETIKKTVYYFIMKAVGGSIEKHDMEMEEVEWLPKEEVEKRLTYPSDKKVWKEAQDLIK